MRNFLFAVLVLVLSVIPSIAQSKGTIRILDQATTDRYMERIKNLSTAELTSGKPAAVIYVTGSSYTGIYAHAYNAVDLPDGTVMVGVKTSFSSTKYEVLTSVYIGGVFPAGQFRYPLENGLKGDWTERPNTLVYQVYTFFPNGEVSTTTGYKDFNKYWTTQVGPPRLISGGTTVRVGNAIMLNLTGPIVGSNSLSVVLKDPELDYNQVAVPASAVRRVGGQLQINLTASGYEIGVNGEIVVIVANELGYSDQFTVRLPIEQVIIPATK